MKKQARVQFLKNVFNLLHARCSRVLKINIDQTWNGIPEMVIKFCWNLCPAFLKQTKLSFIGIVKNVSEIVGSQTQEDLVDKQKKKYDYKWVLH